MLKMEKKINDYLKQLKKQPFSVNVVNVFVTKKIEGSTTTYGFTIVVKDNLTDKQDKALPTMIGEYPIFRKMKESETEIFRKNFDQANHPRIFEIFSNLRQCFLFECFAVFAPRS